jgi:hypothetical protein
MILEYKNAMLVIPTNFLDPSFLVMNETRDSENTFKKITASEKKRIKHT